MSMNSGLDKLISYGIPVGFYLFSGSLTLLTCGLLGASLSKSQIPMNEKEHDDLGRTSIIVLAVVSMLSVFNLSFFPIGHFIAGFALGVIGSSFSKLDYKSGCRL